MAQTDVLCPVTVPSFGLSPDDPMYYTELTNWIIAKNIEAMAAAGLQWSDGVPDDLESAWDTQDETLSQQSSILTDLEEETETLSPGWLSRVTAIKSQITDLLGLTESAENYLSRASAISLIEGVISTVAGLAKVENPSGGESDLQDILKAALLKEFPPGSGTYISSTVLELEAMKEHLEAMLQAIQDLQYNDEILELPATPRPIRIHLKGKTIQQ